MFIWQHICGFWRGRDGASAAEYAIMLALIGAGVVVAVQTLTGNVSAVMTGAGSAMPFQGP